MWLASVFNPRIGPLTTSLAPTLAPQGIQTLGTWAGLWYRHGRLWWHPHLLHRLQAVLEMLDLHEGPQIWLDLGDLGFCFPWIGWIEQHQAACLDTPSIPDLAAWSVEAAIQVLKRALEQDRQRSPPLWIDPDIDCAPRVSSRLFQDDKLCRPIATQLWHKIQSQQSPRKSTVDGFSGHTLLLKSSPNQGAHGLTDIFLAVWSRVATISFFGHSTSALVPKKSSEIPKDRRQWLWYV